MVWRLLDSAITLDLEAELNNEEIRFVSQILDQKAQKAFNECKDYEANPKNFSK